MTTAQRLRGRRIGARCLCINLSQVDIHPMQTDIGADGFLGDEAARRQSMPAWLSAGGKGYSERKVRSEPCPGYPQLGVGRAPLLADAETREDATQQVVGGECAGDFAQVLLGLAQILGQQFAGAIVDKLAVAMLQRLPCQA